MRDIYYKPLLTTIKSLPMSESNIILNPAERVFADFMAQKSDLIESTKLAIKEQMDVARKADAAVARLESQLDNLLA